MVVGNKSIFFAFILAKEEIKQGFKKLLLMRAWIANLKKLPEKLRRYAPTKGNHEKTDRQKDSQRQSETFT